MNDKRYFFSVSAITLVILALGAYFWSTGTVHLDTETTPETAWHLGEAGAPVVIDVYPDFTCAVCLEKARFAVQAYETWPDEVLMVYHPYPTQPLSETIAVALEAAGEQGKFWDLHDLLITDDPGDIAVMISSAGMGGIDITTFTAEFLEDAAEEIGLDMALFKAALTDASLMEKVREERQEAIIAGVQSAGVFINGEEYARSHSTLDEFFEVLDTELERLGTDAGK